MRNRIKEFLPQDFPPRFGLLDEINFLLDRCNDYVEAADRRLEEAKLRTYSDVLGELNAALDLYFDMRAMADTAAQLLPRYGRLRGLIETKDTQRLKAEHSRLSAQVWKIADQVAALRKRFWSLVVEQDPDLYPYDLEAGHFELHMCDIEREAFEL